MHINLLQDSIVNAGVVIAIYIVGIFVLRLCYPVPSTVCYDAVVSHCGNSPNKSLAVKEMQL